jgi:hypothetical protein
MVIDGIFFLQIAHEDIRSRPIILVLHVNMNESESQRQGQLDILLNLVVMRGLNNIFADGSGVLRDKDLIDIVGRRGVNILFRDDEIRVVILIGESLETGQLAFVYYVRHYIRFI